MSEKKIKVAIYDDNKALCESLSQLIESDTDFELSGVFNNPLNILENISKNKPDVILMDIDMPGMTGIEAVALVHKKFPEIKVLMQTVFDDDEKVFNSICSGAVGYLLKKTKPLQMLEGIKEASKGGAPMTPSIATKVLKMFRQYSPPPTDEKINLSEREKEVLGSLTKGQSYKMIAAGCNLSIDTVRFHIKNIYEKLHVHSMTEAVIKALKEKLI